MEKQLQSVAEGGHLPSEVIAKTVRDMELMTLAHIDKVSGL
jgi:hypothetical protein